MGLQRCLVWLSQSNMMLWSASGFEKKRGGGGKRLLLAAKQPYLISTSLFKMILLNAGCKCMYSVIQYLLGVVVHWWLNWRLKQSNNGREKKRLMVRVWDLFAGSVSKWCTVLESSECQFAVEKSLIAFQFLSLPAVINPTTGRKRLELFNMAPGEFTAEVSAVQLPCFYCFYCFCSGTFLLKKKKKAALKIFLSSLPPC